MTHDVEDVVGELKYFHLVKKKNSLDCNWIRFVSFVWLYAI